MTTTNPDKLRDELRAIVIRHNCYPDQVDVATAKAARDAADLIEALTAKLDGYKHHLDACEQIAGKALGYPWFKDDQKNFPGATEADGVCIGEHVGDTIVEELANRFTRIEAAEGERDEVTFRIATIEGDWRWQFPAIKMMAAQIVEALSRWGENPNDPEIPEILLAASDNARRADKDFAALQARCSALVEGVRRPVTMQDVRLAVGEGKLKPADVLAGCNAELFRRLQALVDGGEKGSACTNLGGEGLRPFASDSSRKSEIEKPAGAMEPVSPAMLDLLRARYRCTRCGRDEMDASQNGCRRGPCPMELTDA